MPVSAGKFLESLSSLSLLSQADLSGIRGQLTDVDLQADAETLAKDLIRSGKLTKYQASVLYQGKGKGLVFGEYVVIDKLGSGGMGQVFKAQHRRMKRIVALKVLPPHATTSPQKVQRFYQEVELAAKLTHPNIVTAYDAGEAHGLHYLVIEFVDGQDLSSILANQGPLTLEQAMNCIRQAAEGLAYAHEQGIIHRDIKPANLLVDKQGNVKVLDMGLARSTSTTDSLDAAANSGLTQEGQVMGTVDYMAPEQARDTRHADHRADIYSLGCTLYRLVTGKIPYPADTMVKKIMAHAGDPIPSLRDSRPEVPAKLDELFQRMLAKDPAERIQQAREVAATLKAMLAGYSEEASSVSVLDDVRHDDDLQNFLKSGASSTLGMKSSCSKAPSNSQIAAKSVPRSESSVKAPRPTRNSRRTAILVGGASLLIVLLSLGAWWSWRGSRVEPIAEVPPVVTVEPPVVPTNPESKKIAPPQNAAPQVSFGETKPEMPAPTKPLETPEPAKPMPETPPVVTPPPAAPASPPVVAVTGPVDLLKQVDLQVDRRAGVWKRDGDSLTVENDPGSPHFYSLRTAVIAPPAYRVTLEFMRPASDSLTFGIGLPLSSKHCVHFFADTAPTGRCGLSVLDGKNYHGNETTHLRPLVDDRSPHTIVAVVVPVDQGKSVRIVLALDGQPVVDWQGELDRCAPGGSHGFTPQIELTGNTQARITKWQLEPLLKDQPYEEQVPRSRPLAPTNLLARVDLSRDADSGSEWRLDRQQLLVPNQKTIYPMLALPGDWPDAYRVQMILERTSLSGSDFSVGLPVRGTRVLASVDLGLNVGGFSCIDAGDVLSGVRKDRFDGPLLLAPGRLHRVDYWVSPQRLSMHVNGRQIASFQGETHRLGDWQQRAFPQRYVAYLSSERGGFRVARLTIADAKWQKALVPSTSDRALALAKIKQTFSVAYDKSAKSDAKLIAADQLLKAAALESQDTALRFVQLDESLRFAVEAGELLPALAACLDLIDIYNVETRDYEKRVIDAFKAPRSVEARRTLLEDAARAMEQAAALERFDLAIDIQAAMTAALKPPNADLQKELRTRAVEYKHWSTEWQAAQDARAKLAENDDDPKAHDVLGRYLGVARGEWLQAVQHLAKGSDTAWRAIAESEAKYPDSAVDQAALGDKYWALGDKAAAPLKFLYLERADVWYRRAIAKLSATARTPVERRREQLGNQRKQSGAVFALRHPLDATKIGDHWYKYYATPATWPQAVAACERVGGQLVMIESAAENQAVAQMALADRNRLTGEEKLTCWLGASDIESEGTFKWLNGKSVSGGYANWTPGEPNNAGGNEDAVFTTITFSTSRVDSLWADWGEAQPYDFICEWDW